MEVDSFTLKNSKQLFMLVTKSKVWTKHLFEFRKIFYIMYFTLEKLEENLTEV
jgi:hypothetical protein